MISLFWFMIYELLSDVLIHSKVMIIAKLSSLADTKTSRQFRKLLANALVQGVQEADLVFRNGT